MSGTLSFLLEVVVAVCLLVGAAFAFIGSFGLARMADFYSRLHGPSKATTLGVGAMLVGSAVHFSARGAISLHEVLITFFLFLTTPVSAHLLAKAALHLRLPNVSGAPSATNVTPPGEPAAARVEPPESDARTAAGTP